jgi:hypothetical protein
LGALDRIYSGAALFPRPVRHYEHAFRGALNLRPALAVAGVGVGPGLVYWDSVDISLHVVWFSSYSAS